MVGTEIVDLIDSGHPVPVVLFAMGLSLLFWLVGGLALPWLKSQVKAKGLATFDSSGIKGQERARMAIADIEVSDPQGPLSALSDVNIKKYYAKWLARKSAGRYVPIQLESCVAVIVLLLFPTISTG